MDRSLGDLRDLGRSVAELQDQELAEIELDTKERLLSAPVRHTRPRRARWWLAAGLAAAVIAVAALWLWPRSLAFEIGPEASAGHVDEWIAAPADRSLSLRFSDGTELELSKLSQVRVISTSRAGAELVVERGRIEVAVVPRSGSQWRLRFGPYRVEVTGTRFTAEWNPEQQRLSVELAEGSVRVTGPALGEGRSVQAGNRLVASATEQRFAISSTASEERTPEVGAGGAGAQGEELLGEAGGPGEPEVASQEQAAPPARAARRAPLPAWRLSYDQGKHKQALRQARAEGFEELCQQLEPADLMVLADTARFGGDSALAEQAFTALRSRFPQDDRAAVAAFVLGSMAFDHQGAYGQAGQWFATYLAEQPGGALASEAAGRLMEARERAGDTAGARAAAQQYLQSFPDGPHGERARKLLATQAP